MYKFKTMPWAHQLKALDYLAIRDHGALYTTMGTGKTKVFIDLMVNRDFEYTIIVAPLKACEVWCHEIKKHSNITPNFVFKAYKLSTSDKGVALKEFIACSKNLTGNKVIIVNYDSVWRKPFGEKLLTAIKKLNTTAVICDESHRIKAPASKTSLFLTRLGKVVKHRYLCTGTPNPESPVDVYAQYRFLDPSVFGTNFGIFRDQYENINVAATSYAGYRVLDKKTPYKNLDLLSKKMFSCAFFDNSSVKLPSYEKFIVGFNVPKETQEIYKEVSKEGVYEDTEGMLEVNNALTKVLRQQQILSGYIPLELKDFTTKSDKTLDTARADTLKDLIDGIKKDEKIVVFAKFRWDFEQIKKICKDTKRQYGEISGAQNDYENWKNNKVNLLAVQYKSGAESIDLTEARYCIFYTLSHSYGQYKQALKRVHRPGQTRQVFYYTLCCTISGVTTIDQQISKALKNKKDVVDYVMRKAL